MKNLIFKDNQFSFQLLRLLGEAVYNASDIGEVISTGEKIKEGDFESWCEEWSQIAKRIHNNADEFYTKGHRVSAKKAYLRASNYYRTAEFYLHENPKDPKIHELYDASLKCFSYVMELNSPIIESIEIPYEGTTLPAHYYKLDNSNKMKPVLIAMTGYDGTKEELYGLAMTALEHGMNCIAFEGPGQGEVVRKRNLFFRYDYEKVITSIVDYLLTLEEIDSNKIVLWGESLGGYLAPRAVAFEHRIAACVANGGVYDFSGAFIKGTNMTREEFFEEVKLHPKEFSESIEKQVKVNSELRWAVSHGMYVFGVESLVEFVLRAEKYYLKGVAEKIQCPMLIVDAENDKSIVGQAKPLYDELKCKKDYMVFTTEEGAGEHCQVGAKLIEAERIFNWIEKILCI